MVRSDKNWIRESKSCLRQRKMKVWALKDLKKFKTCSGLLVKKVDLKYG